MNESCLELCSVESLDGGDGREGLGVGRGQGVRGGVPRYKRNRNCAFYLKFLLVCLKLYIYA